MGKRKRSSSDKRELLKVAPVFPTFVTGRTVQKQKA